MADFFHKLLEKKIRILVYNGDLDMMCNFLGGQWFVNDLNAPLKSSKRPWLIMVSIFNIPGLTFPGPTIPRLT